jgi:hypothetical protein
VDKKKLNILIQIEEDSHEKGCHFITGGFVKWPGRPGNNPEIQAAQAGVHQGITRPSFYFCSVG